MHSFKGATFALSMLFCASVFALGEQKQDVAVIQLSIEEQLYLKGKQQLTMCVDPDWMPYEKIEQGRHVGMSADFMRLFSRKINIPIVLKPSKSWLESLAFGRQRQCDIFSLLLSTPEREKFLDFSEPYTGFPLVIATRYEHIFINDIASILDKRLGVQKGYAYAELLRLQYPAINLIEVESLDVGLEQVNNNQLFGMIGSLPSVAYAFQNKYIGELKISGKLEHIWHLGVGVRNDEPLLIGVFNKAIASVDKKERSHITSRWLTTHYELGADYQLLIKVLSVLAVIFIFLLYRHFQLRQYNRSLEHLSVTDKLTDISNRIKLDQLLEKCLSLAKRYQQHFSIILLDMDEFKAINDSHGHLVGDYVLQATAQLLKDNIRTVDTVGRWGGEEFMIICPEQSAEGAQQLAEKLRVLIAEFSFEHQLNLTCSFGVSRYQALDSSDTLIKRADDALYRAKAKGRNCVVLARERI